MADRNFNQGNQSHQSQDWDNERNRYNQDNEWNLQNQGSSGYSSQQNRSMNQGYRDVGYSGDSAHGMGSGDQGRYSRTNYIPDNDENRGYGNRDYENTQYGTSGSYGYRGSGMDYNPGGYRSENRGSFGNAGNDYGQSDWNRQRNYGNEGNWNSRNWQQSGAGNWGSDYGRQDWNRGAMNMGYNQQDYGNRGYGNRYENTNYGSNRGSDYNRGWNSDRNRDTGHHGDENWWEKTKDKVSSWFDSDDDRRDRSRDYSGGHRGKGPSDYRRSEARIREDICDRLTDDDRVDASNIRVQIENDNTVILSGTVNSREEKRRAEDLVESISGVRDVENRLRVGHTSDQLAKHDYTGNTDMAGGIGTESGTTNEIIRNANAERRNK